MPNPTHVAPCMPEYRVRLIANEYTSGYPMNTSTPTIQGDTNASPIRSRRFSAAVHGCFSR